VRAIKEVLPEKSVKEIIIALAKCQKNVELALDMLLSTPTAADNRATHLQPPPPSSSPLGSTSPFSSALPPTAPVTPVKAPPTIASASPYHGPEGGSAFRHPL
jgi:hypothetical protein